MTDDNTWQFQAACRGHSDPDAFFPRPRDVQAKQRIAKLCNTCPVKYECRVAADANDERYGIWGGMERDQQNGGPVHIPEQTAAQRKRAQYSAQMTRGHYNVGLSATQRSTLTLLRLAVEQHGEWVRARDLAGSPIRRDIYRGLIGLEAKGLVETSTHSADGLKTYRLTPTEDTDDDNTNDVAAMAAIPVEA